MPQTKTQTQTPKACTCEDCPMFNDYGDNGRGLCKIFDKVSRRHHALTLDCLSSLPPETEFCKYSESDKVKLKKKNKHHSEWASFVVIGKKYNQGRFKTTKSYLNEPTWYILIATVDKPIPEQYWKAETDICHEDHSAFIETAEVF